MDKTNILGWAVVISVIGGMGYIGYRGFQSIFGGGIVKAAGTNIEELTGDQKSIDDDTSLIDESILSTGYAISIEDDPAVKAALENFQRELKEYDAARDAYNPFWQGSGSDEYKRVTSEYSEMIDSANELMRISGGRYRIAIAQG